MSTLQDYEVEVFFDGDCPLCRREIDWLKRLDHEHRIRFTDIGALDFCTDGLGVSFKDLMDRIHGRLPDGSLIVGPEVFRRLYTAVGLGGWVAWTGLPGVRWVVDAIYNRFAKYRLRLTGRCHAGKCNIAG